MKENLQRQIRRTAATGAKIQRPAAMLRLEQVLAKLDPRFRAHIQRVWRENSK